jgi:integrase
MAIKLGVDIGGNVTLLLGKVRSAQPKESLRDKRRAFTKAERMAVLQAADEMVATVRAEADSRAGERPERAMQAVADLIWFLAYTGVRINEARLQRWEDVHLKEARVHVRGTKTTKSDRWLNLPKPLLKRLKQAAKRTGKAGYVFASQAGVDSPMDTSNLASKVRAVLDSAGMQWATSHAFRRTVNTMLLDAGVPPQRVADQLGHANVTMTLNVYAGRDLAGDKSDMAEKLV